MPSKSPPIVQSGAVGPEVQTQRTNNAAGTESRSHVVTGLGRSALWRYAALAAMTLESVIVAAIALRRLGATEYGAFAIAAATIGLLATIDFGLSLSVMRSVAHDNSNFPEEERKQARGDVVMAHSTYVLCGAATLFCTALIIWLLPLLTSSKQINAGQDRLTILLVGVSIALYLATAVFDGIPSGRGIFGVTAISAICGAVAGIAFVVFTIGQLHLVALGGGQLAGTIVTRVIGGTWIRRHENWFHFLPKRVTRRELRRVAAFTLPLLVISVGGQVIATTDLVVIGALSTAAAIAFYRIGSLAPNQLITTIFTGFDASFPSLSSSTSRRNQEDEIAFLNRIVCYVTGVSFGALVMLRSDVVTIVLGHSTALATTVLVVFSGVWIANAPVHGLALLLIARGRQRSFIPLVAIEALVNIGLTVGFVFAFGPIGAAEATLVTIVISNDFVLPYIIRRELEISSYRIVWLNGFPTLILGGSLSALAILPFHVLHPGALRLCLGAALAAVVGLFAGYLLLGSNGRKRFETMLRKTTQLDEVLVPNISQECLV